MWKIIVMAAPFLIGLLTACEGPEFPSDPIRLTEFYGTYKAEFGTALIDEIEFRSNGTYVHRYQGKVGSVVADTNRFEFYQMPGSRSYSVSLQRFVFFDSQQYCWSFSPSRDDWVIPLGLDLVVKRRGSRQSIALCPDERKYYVKIK